MDYQSPGAAISEGLQSGLGLAAKYSEMKQQREQHQWNQQLKVAEMGMKLTENDHLPVEQRVSAFNKGVRPVLKRLGMDMPEMTSANASSDAFQEAVKNSTGIIDQMQKGELDPHVGFNAITQHFTGALNVMKSETEGQKTQRELVVNNAKQYTDQADKKNPADKTPSPAEAIHRQSELQIQLANLNKTDMNSQITAGVLKKAGFNVDPGKVTPEMVDQVKGAVRKELSFLNQYLPDEYRHKEGITMAEAQALKAKGFSNDRMARDFHVTDAPGGMDPLAMHLKRKPSVPAVAPTGGAPMPTPAAAAPAPVGAPITPPPLATPAPMAAPAPVPPPQAGPLSLSGGATQPSPSAYPLPRQQSLQ